MIKLVLSDMDNTLVAYGQPCVSDFALDAIHELQATGVVFAPASGRGIVELRHFFQDDAACSCALASSGKEVWVDGKLRSQTVTTADQLSRVAALLEDINDACLVTYGDGEHPTLAIGASQKLATDIQPVFPLGIDRTPDVPTYDVVACGLICLGGQPHLEDVRAMLKAAVPDLDYVQSVASWCDIMPAGFTKATAVTQLEGLLGIDASEVMAFGDSDNDLAMLEYVGMPVAVSNANERVRAVARWQIGSAEDEAVAHALHDIANATRTGTTPRFMTG